MASLGQDMFCQKTPRFLTCNRSKHQGARRAAAPALGAGAVAAPGVDPGPRGVGKAGLQHVPRGHLGRGPGAGTGGTLSPPCVGRPQSRHWPVRPRVFLGGGVFVSGRPRREDRYRFVQTIMREKHPALKDRRGNNSGWGDGGPAWRTLCSFMSQFVQILGQHLSSRRNSF